MTSRMTVRSAGLGSSAAISLENCAAESLCLDMVFLRDRDTAEDTAQEAFIKAWSKLGDFRMESSFKSWLHRITVNAAMDHLRKHSRRSKFETEETEWEAPDHTVMAADAGTQIDISKHTQAAIMQLSVAERTALLLKHYEGHSIAEIARIMGTTTGACKQNIFRAVKKMRVALEPLVTA